MKKILPILSFMMCLLVPVLAFSMEAAVEITGPQELTSLKSGIEKSVITRCIAKGIELEKYQKITISLSKLGDIISYDALLDTKPVRAFHKDFKDTSALSATIDEMIDAIFSETRRPQTAEIQLSKALTGKEIAPKIMLPFIATSIAAVGDSIYISDTKTVYELKGDKPSPMWEAPGNNEILRITPHGESIIVLAKNKKEFRSFMIQGTETKERWDMAVLPLGDGLISSALEFDRTISTEPSWSKISQVAGTSPQIPPGLDIISAISCDNALIIKGDSIISYNMANKLAMSSKGSITCSSDFDAGKVPLYIENQSTTQYAHTDFNRDLLSATTSSQE